jgi:hypothetical protein
MAVARKRWSASARLRIFLAHAMPEPNSGCWLWTGSIKPNGYGNCGSAGRSHNAHRLSYELHVGEIPAGMVIRHRCDTPSCVNPDHLISGTQLENIQDCIAKGRARRGVFPGEASPFAKLTASQVEEIRSAPRPYGYRKVLAKRFGISESGVSKIIGRASWRHR